MIHRLSLTSLSLAALLAAAGCASAPMAPATVVDGTLTGKDGRTLYTFDRDAAGKSMCNGGCATNWPPLTAAADAQPAGDYTVITRDDGSKQYAYKGKPLYYWTKDMKAGDKTGDGFNNVWHAAKP